MYVHGLFDCVANADRCGFIRRELVGEDTNKGEECMCGSHLTGVANAVPCDPRCKRGPVWGLGV